jgi:hypothetical protein
LRRSTRRRKRHTLRNCFNSLRARPRTSNIRGVAGKAGQYERIESQSVRS